jgi:hypothetical protein
VGNGGYTKYNSAQFELRKRLSAGLQLNASYVYGKVYGSSRYSLRRPRVKTLDGGTEGGVVHAFKSNWTYELPFGQGAGSGLVRVPCSTGSSAAGRSTASPGSRAAACSTSATCGSWG